MKATALLFAGVLLSMAACGKSETDKDATIVNIEKGVAPEMWVSDVDASQVSSVQEMEMEAREAIQSSNESETDNDTTIISESEPAE